VERSAAPAISGGTITGVKLGINVNNYEGYVSMPIILLQLLMVLPLLLQKAGIRVHDNPANTNGATVSAEIKVIPYYR
jgi:hypothetical protein